MFEFNTVYLFGNANQTGNARITYHWWVFVQILLLWEAISVTYFECVFVALVIQHAMRMHQYRHLWPIRLYNTFSHYYIKGRIFEKNIERKMCFDFLYNFFSELFLTLRRNQRDVIKIHIGLYVKYPLFSSGFIKTLIFLNGFSKTIQISISRHSFNGNRSVQTEGQNKMKNLRSDLSNLANVPTNRHNYDPIPKGHHTKWTCISSASSYGCITCPWKTSLFNSLAPKLFF